MGTQDKWVGTWVGWVQRGYLSGKRVVFPSRGVMQFPFRWKKGAFLWVKRNLHLTGFFIQ